MSKRKHQEDDEQAYLFQWASYFKELDWMHAIPNGGNRDAREAARLKAQGVKPGVLDIFLPLPMSPYHGLYVEMKRPDGKGRMSFRQTKFKAYAELKGYKCVVCNTWIEAKDAISSYARIS